MDFEWDGDKAARNRRKHGVSFTLAARVFLDDQRIECYDGREPYGEERFLTVGLVAGVELAVVYTLRGPAIRLISDRKADRHERQDYWQNR